MNKIYLVRHGQDEDNERWILNWHRDRPLTKIGLEQANQIALKIKYSNIIFDKILSSPLQRAYKTAKIIANIIENYNIEKNNLLIERNFGVMTGKLVEEIYNECFPDILETEKITYFLSPDGAETFPQLIDRANNLLNLIKTEYNWKTLLLVTHWDFGKMIYAAYYKLDWQQVLKMFHFWNSEMLLLSEKSAPEDSHVFNIVQYNS